MNLKFFLLSFFPTFFVVGLVMYLSFAPPSFVESVPMFPISDKLVHFCMYFGLSSVFLFDFWRYGEKKPTANRFLSLCFFLPILFGGLVEIAQECWFASRSGEFLDFLANTAGVIAAWILMTILFFYLRRKKQKDPN